MSENNSIVEYRDIKGFPGNRVGSDGTVWCARRNIGLGRGRGTIASIGDIWRQKKLSVKLPLGHLYVRLHPGNKIRYVHRLVLEAFVGPCPRGMQCCHFPDRNPANNALDNVRWGTGVENMADRVIHGNDARGEKSVLAKITEQDVYDIRDRYALGGITQRELGENYGLGQVQIGRIIRRERWEYTVE